jgi:transcriptional regulator with XRE-family HTH domain
MGAPPAARDLLRALRMRGGWTQEPTALRLGVDQSSVVRGERLLSNEQMQALCFALEAHEGEPPE